MRTVPVALAVAFLVVAAAWALVWRREAPLLEMRTRPLHLHAGRPVAGQTFGQGFACDAAGLRRVDVAFVQLDAPPVGELVLRLRHGAPDGPVVREARAPASAVPPGDGGFVAFEFEPLPDSAGEEFFVELTAAETPGYATCSPYVRWRGALDLRRMGGDRALEGPRLVREVHAERADLAGVALPLRAMDAREEGVRLALVADEDAPPLRTAEVEPRARQYGGYVFLPFPPLAESYWGRYRLLVEVPPGATVIGSPAGASYVLLHGAPDAQPRLLGMTSQGELHADRDLVIRAFADVRAEERLVRSLGWRLPAALVTWTLALAAGAAALAAARAPARDPARDPARAEAAPEPPRSPAP